MSNKLESDFGFVLASKYSGAISFEEFHQWVEHTIAQGDNLPTYYFDLYDAKDLSEVDNVLRDSVKYTVTANLNHKESQTLWGIAAKRGHTLESFKGLITKETALKRLQQCPHIVERFRETFPFIDLKV